MQTVKITFLILILLVLLGACGLKGPLYLPNESPVSEAAIEQEADPTVDETEEKEDSEEKGSGIKNQ